MAMSLSGYLDLLRNAPVGEAYKVYEKYAKALFSHDLSDKTKYVYWTVNGEAIQTYAVTEIFECRETLEGKLTQTHRHEVDDLQRRPEIYGKILNPAYVESVLKLMPNACQKCGFYRFFGLKINETSLGQFVTVFCPSCRKEFGTIDADSMEIEPDGEKGKGEKE